MPKSLLPIAATAVGYYFGGPWGALAASAIYSTVFAKKPEAPQLSQNLQDRVLTIRQPAAPWQVIYGEARVGGTLTFIESVNANQDLLLVITFAGHECQSIGDIYFDDELLSLSGSGNNVSLAVGGRFAGYATIIKSVGAEGASQPFPDMVTSSNGIWQSASLQRGRTKMAVILHWNAGVFPNGLPNITAVIKGRKVFDHRYSPTERVWSDNAALCIADYLTDTNYGMGCDLAEIDLGQLVSAANTCEEQVALNLGSPTQFEERYTLNGAFNAEGAPRELLGRLLTAMNGQVRFIGGQWQIFPAVYATPTVTLTADDLRGAVHILPRLSRRDACNGVKGLYIDPDNNYQPGDFPQVTNSTYLTEDNGERIWRELDLPFTNSASMAQRIAKIELERARQQITLELACKITMYQVQPGDTVLVTLARYGYSAKAFEVVSSTLVIERGADDAPILGVDLVLRETAAAVFDWSSGEETTVDPAPDTELPDPFAELDITGLAASSGTADLFRQGDGTIVPRVRLRWTAPGNAFVSYYEIQFTRLDGSPTEWVDAPDVEGTATQAFAHPVEDGVRYDLRIRAVTVLANPGAWSYVRGHTVAGKTAVPSDVTGATAVQTGGIVVMGCAAVDDADLDAVEVRLHDAGETDYADATPIANILRGQTVTSAAIPPGTWELLFKAKDTSGNYSTNVARVTITVTADGFTTISSNAQAVQWLGSRTNMVLHWTGVLTPESQSLASALGWEVFDEFVPNAEEDCYYYAPVIDKSIDATARIYGDIVSVLGPGETSGVASPMLEVDHRTASGSFDGFEPWTVGSVEFRYLWARIHVDTTIGKPVISQFTPTIDAASRTETGTLTVGGGGSGSLTFDTPFHNTPVLRVSPQGSGDVTASWDSLTATGFTGYFKTAGAASAGTMSYDATGA